MSSKKVSVRLQEGEGYVVLTEQDMENLATLFQICSLSEERRADFKRGWVAAASKFRAAKSTVYAPEEEDW